MKTKKLFFIALSFYFICNTALAQTSEHKTYDYVTIVAYASKPDRCSISINGEKYEEVKLEKPKEWFDYNGVIKIIKKYEVEGYEIFTNNVWGVGIVTYNYFLLRKEHKE